jgi:predicted  nucleic acid-binding Zn-ribbon protein
LILKTKKVILLIPESVQTILRDLESEMELLTDRFHTLQATLKANLPKVSTEIIALQNDLEAFNPKISNNKADLYKVIFDKLLLLDCTVKNMEDVRGCLKDQVLLINN